MKTSGTKHTNHEMTVNKLKSPLSYCVYSVLCLSEILNCVRPALSFMTFPFLVVPGVAFLVQNRGDSPHVRSPEQSHVSQYCLSREPRPLLSVGGGCPIDPVLPCTSSWLYEPVSGLPLLFIYLVASSCTFIRYLIAVLLYFDIWWWRFFLLSFGILSYIVFQIKFRINLSKKTPCSPAWYGSVD